MWCLDLKGRVVIALVVAIASIGSAEAQPLSEGSIEVVQPKPVLLVHRFEVQPRFGATFNDPLINQFHVGGNLYYHYSERIYFGLTFDWFDFDGELGGTTDAFDQLISATSTIPEVAPVTWYGGADFGWVPINGKLALFDTLIGYYDFYGIVGLGVIDTVDDPHPAANLAVGWQLFITDWLALSLEVRDRMYIEPLPAAGDTFTNILTATLGLGFFIPPTFQYEDTVERILDWE